MSPSSLKPSLSQKVRGQTIIFMEQIFPNLEILNMFLLEMCQYSISAAYHGETSITVQLSGLISSFIEWKPFNSQIETKQDQRSRLRLVALAPCVPPEVSWVVTVRKKWPDKNATVKE